MIDFGSWLGPTVLFAAPYAKKVRGRRLHPSAVCVSPPTLRLFPPPQVYSMEPDIGAYEELYWNIKYNPDRAAKISL